MTTHFRSFVIEDDVERGTTVVNDFGRDNKGALAFLQERERALFPWTSRERVCYFRADSVDTLRYTHGSWFHRDVSVVAR